MGTLLKYLRKEKEKGRAKAKVIVPCNIRQPSCVLIWRKVNIVRKLNIQGDAHIYTQKTELKKLGKRKRRKLRRKLRRGWSRKKSTGPWYRSPPLDSNHSTFPPHVPVLSCTPITSFSTQDLELLLSHREEIEKIQNFVADLQSAGLQGRVL